MRPVDVDIGLVIPVLNERAVLGAILDDIAACLDGGRYTICVVDDGSTDGTIELLKERALGDPRIVPLLRRKSGPGCRRGGASRAGLAWLLANTTHAFFSDVDADGANRPDELLRGLGLATSTHADVVIASKYVPGAVVTGRPLARRAGSRAYNLALRALMDWRVHDYSNSFRIYRRAAADLLSRMTPRYDTPVYLVEMMATWLSHGLLLVEMPTIYRERETGASKVIPGDFLRGAAGAIRVGLAYRAGRYRG
jgi:glycosyltransferase involved in cell wall biosynthesis